MLCAWALVPGLASALPVVDPSGFARAVVDTTLHALGELFRPPPRSLQPRDPHQPSLEIGTPSVEDASYAPQVRRHLKRHLMVLLHCYELGLEHAPALTGTVVASFTVESSGRISAANATGPSEVSACMAGVIREIRLPPPARAPLRVSVEVTLVPALR
jgi:hypothetical protein